MRGLGVGGAGGGTGCVPTKCTRMPYTCTQTVKGILAQVELGLRCLQMRFAGVHWLRRASLFNGE